MPGTQKKKYVSKSKTAKSTSMTTVLKQIKSIKKRIGPTQDVMLKQQFDGGIGSRYNAFNLCNYSNMTPVFGADASDVNQASARIKWHQLIGRVSLENGLASEEESVTCSMFLVSFKNLANTSSVWSSLSGTLNLTEDLHYTWLDGHVLLNKRMFKIHAARYFTLTNNGTTLGLSSAQTQSGTDYGFNFKLYPNDLITNVDDGDWKNEQTGKVPSRQHYLIVFNNNNGIDGEFPRIVLSQLVKAVTN